MDFPTLISRTRALPILGVLNGIFHFYRTLCSEDPDQTPHYAASDPVLHCLLSHKKDSRLKWSKILMHDLARKFKHV